MATLGAAEVADAMPEGTLLLESLLVRGGLLSSRSPATAL